MLAFGLLAIFGASAAAQSAPPSAGHSTILVTDEAGRSIQLPQPVRRIVSLAPNLTETVFAVGAGDLVVGDTDFCNYPAEAMKKVRVGGPVNPSIERIVALHPDLVLATVAINRLATVQSLERLGVAVYVTDPRTVDDVLSSIQRVGALLNANDKAKALVATLRVRLNKLQQQLSGTEPLSVFFVTWVDPLISVGSDTFLFDALRLAGARSIIATSQDWPNVNLEEVIRQQPQYLIFSSDDPEQVRRQVAELRGRPAWLGLDALQRNHIIVLSEAFSRPAPRLIDSIEQLARELHPDRFASDGFTRPPALPDAGARVAIRGAL